MAYTTSPGKARPTGVPPLATESTPDSIDDKETGLLYGEDHEEYTREAIPNIMGVVVQDEEGEVEENLWEDEADEEVWDRPEAMEHELQSAGSNEESLQDKSGVNPAGGVEHNEVSSNMEAGPKEAEKVDEDVICDGPDVKGFPVDPFHIALLIFVTAADLSIDQYKALREVLLLATIDSLKSLPKSLHTLRQRGRRNFPLLSIKARKVEIALQSVPPKTESPGFAYRFSIMEYCDIWLSNPSLRKNMHFGLGEIVDTFSELWHGDVWMESVRTSSGQFGRIMETPASNVGSVGSEVVLLPSDCVTYRDEHGNTFMGRVKCIGVDKRRDGNGGIVAIVNSLVEPGNLPLPWRYKYDRLSRSIFADVNVFDNGQTDLPELILIEDRHIVPLRQIVRREWVYFIDYPSEEELRGSLLPIPAQYCVKKIAYNYRGKDLMRAVHKRHRVIAESELQQFGRNEVLRRFAGNDVRVLSVPYTTFLDAFGLYRNAYHSLDGMYVTPASIDVGLRTKLQNVFVLMLGPFGSNEMEMAKCLKNEATTSGVGYRTTLQSGETVFVCAFPIAFNGDMPQQNLNSGCKTHNVYKGCRYCFITDNEKGNLMENVVDTGRYREPVRRLRAQALAQRTKDGRDKQLKGHGLTLEGAYFENCYPHMDPQRCHPNDAFHAEIRLEKYYQEALIECYLTTAGAAAYREVWNKIEAPKGWGQPQNPVSHKGSMVFSEYGRLAIMNPLVILKLYENMGATNGQLPKRQWIWKPEQIEILGSKLGFEEMMGFPPEHQVLRIAYLHARCIYYTMRETLTAEERDNMVFTILASRHHLQKFFEATEKYASWGKVPNIHLGLHYTNDLENFGTIRNSTTMMGEQKHKLFKAHASHTNSRENDLQLLKVSLHPNIYIFS